MIKYFLDEKVNKLSSLLIASRVNIYNDFWGMCVRVHVRALFCPWETAGAQLLMHGRQAVIH